LTSRKSQSSQVNPRSESRPKINMNDSVISNLYKQDSLERHEKSVCLCFKFDVLPFIA
jgi:hypothetical protein